MPAMPTEPQPPTLSEAERDVLSAINASHGQEVMFDRVDHLLAARHEQATQEADRRVAEVVAAVEAVRVRLTKFADGRARIWEPGPHDDEFNQGLRRAIADLTDALAPFRSEVTGGGDG